MSKSEQLQTSQTTSDSKPDALWDLAFETDPNFTKKVPQRGGFTTINAMWQVQQATRLLGQCGVNWGFDVEYLRPDDELIFAELTLWVGKHENHFGPICGCAQLLNKGRTDTDAPKKAMTDALTKALSYLGFSADVFLGQFDDNKYVDELTAKYAPPLVEADEVPLDTSEATTTERSWSEWADDQKQGFKDYQSIDDLKFWHTTQKATLAKLKDAEAELYNELVAALTQRKEDLNNG